MSPKRLILAWTSVYAQFGQPGGFQQPGFQQPGFQQPGFQQPGFQLPGSVGSKNPFNPIKNPATRKTTTESTVTTTDYTSTESTATDGTTVMDYENQNSKSPRPTKSVIPGWEMKEKTTGDQTKDWGKTEDKNNDWTKVPNGYYSEDDQEMKSKMEDMNSIEKSIGSLEEKMMMQAFEFGLGFVLHNMDIIMSQIEPALLRFNSMLESVLSLTTIEEGNLAAHPMVVLIRERTTDIVNATSHLFYYMEGKNDNGAQSFVDTMMDICAELKNKTNDYETFPIMKMIVDMIPGGYDASRESSAKFILSVAEHYQMWYKWENLYEEVMSSYKKTKTMKNQMYAHDEYDKKYDGENGYNHDDRHEMKETYPPMPNTPLGQLFMRNENDTENTIFKVVGELMDMSNGIDMQTILHMVTRLVQNNVDMDLSEILEMAQMFM